MDEINHQEIEKLRERSHEHGNRLQEHEGLFATLNATLVNLDKKMDAQHLSVKEDLREAAQRQEKGFEAVTKRQDVANGRLGEHDKEIAQAKGGLKIMAVGLPVVTGLLLYALVQLLFGTAPA